MTEVFRRSSKPGVKVNPVALLELIAFRQQPPVIRVFILSLCVFSFRKYQNLTNWKGLQIYLKSPL